MFELQVGSEVVLMFVKSHCKILGTWTCSNQQKPMPHLLQQHLGYPHVKIFSSKWWEFMFWEKLHEVKTCDVNKTKIIQIHFEMKTWDKIESFHEIMKSHVVIIFKLANP
jgi:hypothetical protein